MKKLLTAVTFLVAVTLFAPAVHAGDSPQFRGPNRDGIFNEQGLLKQWPEGGPAVEWVAKGLGKGYASLAVVGDLIYVPGVTGEDDGCVFVLDKAGQIVKKIPYGKETLEKEAPGPRSTPTIEGDRLYMLSALGVMYCIDLNTDKTVWSVNLLERFQAENIMWNYAESLLVDGDHVICTPGGKEALMAALDKKTGATVWTTKGLEDKAAYTTPILAVHNGHRMLLTSTAKYIIGVNADTGALLWSFAHKAAWDVHAVTPIYSNGLVYYTSGDGVGGGALELNADATAVTSKWTDTNLDCQHHGVVLVDGYLYGTGHKGVGPLVCLEMATGKLMWKTKEVKQGVVIYADGMLYIYEGPKSGKINLVKADPAKFECTGQVTLTEGTNKHWAHPVIAHGRLYVRHGIL